jgi:hypothetical protein
MTSVEKELRKLTREKLESKYEMYLDIVEGEDAVYSISDVERLNDLEIEMVRRGLLEGED